MSLLRYLVVYGLAIVAVVLLVWAIALTGTDFGGAGLSVVPVFLAAMNEGKSYATTHQAAPEKSVAWRFAVKATLLVVTVQALAAALFYAFVPELTGIFDSILRSDYLWSLAVLLAFFVVMVLISNRIFLSIGARNALKATARAGRK